MADKVVDVAEPKAEEKPKKEKKPQQPKKEKAGEAAAAPSAATTAPAAAAPAAPAVVVPTIPPFMGVSQHSAQGVNVKCAPKAAFNTALAKHLKRIGTVKVPAWADYVKTGVGKELAPYDPDWFFIRAASVARKIYLRPAGIGALRRVYGRKKNNGSRPSHAAIGSGSVIRKVLAQLQELKYIEKTKRGGRRITPTGKRELDRIAAQVVTQTKNRPITI
jgi:small subunit ribosomal protein S19e